MELVFFYINQSSDGFINKQGFNFSGNYHFYVEYSRKDKKNEVYNLKQSFSRNALPCNFFDPDGCIENITAIVGENGAGKTTLLDEIANIYCKVKNEKHAPEYDEFYLEKYERDKFIAIYIEDNQVSCYHNIKNLENKTSDIEKVTYLHEGSTELRDIVVKGKALESISKVCISNSIFAQAGTVSTHSSIRSIDLNLNTINILKNKFFKNKIMIHSKCVGGFYEFQDIIYRYKTIEDFQQLLDVFYLRYLKKQHSDSIFEDKIYHDLELNFYAVLKFLKKEYDDLNYIGNIKEENRPCVKTYKVMINRYLANFDFSLQKKDVFVVAYINLLYEIIAYRRNADDSVEGPAITDKESLIACIDYIIENKLESNKDYFKRAFEEIKKYEKLLEKCTIYHSALPESDMAYTLYIKVSKHNENYEKLLDLIEKSAFGKENSFVLKYMNVGGIRLASGERALLNFFSWLHFLPFFHELDNNIQDSLCENVQFLIDELDLYCHPLWQQKIIKYLIDEIKNHFSNKKVQIIFTTHSPIILSDIPRCNVLYLQEKDGHCFVDRQDSHKETFGANIYKLFDDSFYLGEKGQIGEFAKGKIQQIIEEVIKAKNEKRVDEYNEIQLQQSINLIGEDILRNKLYEMLFKSSCSNNEDIQQRKIKLYEEKIRQLREGGDT